MTRMNKILRIIIIAASLLYLTLASTGCHHEEPENRAAVENALKTAMEAMEHARAAEARMDKLEARIDAVLKQKHGRQP